MPVVVVCGNSWLAPPRPAPPDKHHEICRDPPRSICRFLRHIALLVFHHFKHSRGGARKKAEPQRRNLGNFEFLVRFRFTQIIESWRNFGRRAMAVQARTTTQISNGLRQISLGRYSLESYSKSGTGLIYFPPTKKYQDDSCLG